MNTPQLKILNNKDHEIAGYSGTVFVVKYGGSAMTSKKLSASFARDICILRSHGIKVLIVHGGGKDITETSDRLKVPVKFVNGLRFTDKQTMNIVQMVLIGTINKAIVTSINKLNGKAVGISGIDCNLLVVRKLLMEGVDLGFVGEVCDINIEFIEMLLANDYIPVIAPIGVDENQQTYNINADDAASSLASSMRAEKLIYLSDIGGVLDNEKVIPRINYRKAEKLIERKIVINGMIPKVMSALRSLHSGVGTVHIIDGRIKKPLTSGLFGNIKTGTEIVRSS
jgi:acetylglutamate kinase